MVSPAVKALPKASEELSVVPVAPWVVVAVMPEVPLSVLKLKSLAEPVLPLTKILKGVAASPVLINWAVTPSAALLIAATTPAGVATVTAIDLAGAPCTANDNAKAAPPFRGVAAVAKPALMLRWGAASAETDTEWLPVAAVAPVTTDSAVGWLLLQLLCFLLFLLPQILLFMLVLLMLLN